MENKLIFSFGYLAVLICGALASCDKLPDEFNIEGCCKFPKMNDEAVFKKVSESLKDQNLDGFMGECKVSEGIFKELKLTKDDAFDKDAVLKHLDTEVHEASWKPVMKAAGEECIKDITAKKDEIVKELEKEPFNIKKDQCNPVYMSMVTCIHLEGFENCPKESWKDEKRCNDAKAWIEKCGDKIDSLRELAAKKASKK